MKVVDLFCGTGGFSLGAHKAGFEVPLSIDIDPNLTFSAGSNFPNTSTHLADIAMLSGSDLTSRVNDRISGVIGGPPCQPFSLIGKRDKHDPRRDLIEHFFRLVSEIRPLFFVMENVPGLIQGKAYEALESSLNFIPGNYEVITPLILDASLYGAATNRRRCFVIGFLPEFVDRPDLSSTEDEPKPTVRDAIEDLANASELGQDEEGYDVFELDNRKSISNYAVNLRSPDRRFTGNRRTQHSARIEQRFAAVKPGSSDVIGRHQRLSWSGLCPTLRAGTGPDRGSYQSVRPLHPVEPRVITVREAARLQGFPDQHRFHPTIWHSFRMIGNSIPPPLAFGVMRALAQACHRVSNLPAAAE